MSAGTTCALAEVTTACGSSASPTPALTDAYRTVGVEEPYQLRGDVHVLPSSQAAPGYGVLPVNAYLIRDEAPVLIDTGLASDRDDFLERLWSLVDPTDLRWVFLTHEDRDHAGNLLAVLEAAPDAQLVTNYVTVSKLLEAWEIPLDRVRVVNPGESFSTSARDVLVIRPPAYDASGTVGLWDPSTKAAFTVDAFGAYLPEITKDLTELPEEEVHAGLLTFNRLNHPWTALADREKFRHALHELRKVEPALLLSSHNVPAPGQVEALIDVMARLPDQEPFVPPDQSRFEELRGDMGGG